MDHSGRKVCIMVRYKTYVTTMLSAQSFIDSPQSPQHVAKPQDIEGGRWRGGGGITVRAQVQAASRSVKANLVKVIY